MSAEHRVTRNLFWRPCEYCGQEYIAFRRSSRFCKRAHKEASRRSKQTPFRSEALKKLGARCSTCGSTEGRLFVRALPGQPRTLETVKVYCGACNGEFSRSLFRIREPDAKKGRNYRRNIARKMEREGIATFVATDLNL